MRPLDMQTRQVRASDGSEVTYQVTSGQGPWILLVNGLAADHRIWHHLIDYLRDHYRFITWDVRGLYQSDGESRPGPGPDLVASHASDLKIVLEAEQIDKAVWMAWSAGAQIAFEALASASERLSHLVLLNPTFGAMPIGPLAPIRNTVAPRILSLMERSHRLAATIVHRAARWPETASWVKRLGVVGPTIEEEALSEVATAIGQLDMQAFFRNLHAFESHDPGPLLERVRVPALLIAGQRDLVVSRDAIEMTARRLPGAEAFVVRGATHFMPLEFPELLNLRVEKFFRERGV